MQSYKVRKLFILLGQNPQDLIMLKTLWEVFFFSFLHSCWNFPFLIHWRTSREVFSCPAWISTNFKMLNILEKRIQRDMNYLQEFYLHGITEPATVGTVLLSQVLKAWLWTLGGNVHLEPWGDFKEQEISGQDLNIGGEFTHEAIGKRWGKGKTILATDLGRSSAWVFLQ